MNLARTATVSANVPVGDEGIDRTVLLNDGNGKIEDNSARWVVRGGHPHVIELRWNEPVELGATRLISGRFNGSRVFDPVSHFKLQHHDGEQWQDLAPPVENNENPAFAQRFNPVKSDYLRLVITRAPYNISRLWELELYEPVKTADK